MPDTPGFHSPDFLAPRACLAPHPPESNIAADLLSDAADAVIAGNLKHAVDCLAHADMPVLRKFSRMVMDNQNPAIQRYRRVKPLPIPVKRTAARMPPKADAFGIFKRDGFRCRYCGSRVVLPDARRRLRDILPEAVTVDDKTYHAAFLALNATLDHVVPHARGGDNSPDNIVTTCWPCNFGKEAYSLEELGLIDPRLRSPIVDEWDGLSRLLTIRTPKRSPRLGIQTDQQPPQHTAPPPMQGSWHEAVEAIHPGAARTLLTLIEACGPIGVTGAVNKECMLRLTAAGQTIIPLAVTRAGEVELPWFIGPHKAAFRTFADRIAASIAGAVAYETPKTWSVRMADRRKLNLTDLLAIQPAVISGLMELRDRLTAGS